MPLKVVVVVDAAALLGHEEREEERRGDGHQVDEQQDSGGYRLKIDVLGRVSVVIGAYHIRHRVEGGDSECLDVRAVDGFQTGLGQCDDAQRENLRQ